MLDPAYQKSFWYFENGMLMENLGWGDNGKGDAIGRNAFAYICWPNAFFLKESILKCIKLRDDGFIQIYRYPNWGGDTISRDHVGAIVVAFYINRDWEELDNVLNNLPWRLSRKYSQTVDFWLWHRSLKYRSFWLAQIFYLINVLFFIFTIPWNFFVRKILRIKKIKNLEDAKFIHFPAKSWKWRLHKTLYRHFALFLLAWQIKILPKSWLKWLLQKLLLLESNNAVISAVLGRPITKEQRESFEPITSFIWSRRLDTADDILLRYMSDDESRFNDLNRGMLDYLYYRIDEIMLNFDDKIVDSIKNDDKIVKF